MSEATGGAMSEATGGAMPAASGGAPEAALQRGSRVRRVLLQVLVLNLLVLAAKVVAWISSGALSVAAEAGHSSLDALNNVIALTFAAIAARAPDEDHPYGHQKFETLGALVVVGFLSITVFELTQGAVVRLLGGRPLDAVATPMALWLVLFSAIASLVVSRWELIQGRRLDSPLLVADAAHTRADVYASGAVLVGLLLVRAGMPLADPLVALGVAVVIARTGWQIVQETVPVLVDERAVEDRTIRRIAEATEGVRGAWGIRSRGRPGEIYAELTVSVDPTLDVADAHTIADQVERDVAEALRAREVTVHVEPDETPPPPPPPSAS